MDFIRKQVIFYFVLFNLFTAKGNEMKVENDPEWSHNDQDEWCDVSSMCCGNNQSPISLGENETKKIMIKMTPFKFLHNEDLQEKITITNDGNSVVLRFEENPPELKGGGLLDNYIFDNLHFHWGSTDEGSEHIINGDKAPLEMHIAYFSSKFTNITMAINSMTSDALAVLSVLFQINDNYVNPSMEKITSNFDDVQFKGQSTRIKPFNFLKLIPYKSSFFRYRGSLSTPPCTEIVAWTIFKEFLCVTTEQLQRFRSLFATSRKSPFPRRLLDNFRNIQPLNGRRIYTGWQSRAMYFYKF